MKPFATAVSTSLTRSLSPTSRPCSPRDDPAFGGRREQAHERALVGDAGDDRVELLADPRRQEVGGGDLAHRALDLAGGVLALGAVRRRSSVSSSSVYGGGQVARGRFQQALRDQIGVAAVRRGRVRVVVDGEAEVTLLGIVRALEHVLAGAEQLHDREREIRELGRIGGAALRSGSPTSAFASGSAGSFVPSEPASSTIRSQRFGFATTRRIDDKPRCSRKRAVAPFAAIMRSSISSRARFLVLDLEARRRGRSASRGSLRSSRDRARRAGGGVRAGAARLRPAASAAPRYPRRRAAHRRDLRARRRRARRRASPC